VPSHQSNTTLSSHHASNSLFGCIKPMSCTATNTRWTNNHAEIAMTLFQHDKHLSDKEICIDKYKKIKTRLEHYSFKVSADLPVVLDTGASFSLTPILDDFVTELSSAPINEIRGISATAQVVGQGLVKWPIWDLFGRVRVIQIMAYYVPDATIRLFIPQVYFQENEKGSCDVQGTRVIVNMQDGSALEFPYNAHSNLPLMIMDYVPEAGANLANIESLQGTNAMASLLTVADQTNQNLSLAQRELLSWHWKLDHSHFDWNQVLIMRRKISGPDAGNQHVVESPTVPSRTFTVQPIRWQNKDDNWAIFEGTPVAIQYSGPMRSIPATRSQQTNTF
jgi:hypothetical protein